VPTIARFLIRRDTAGRAVNQCLPNAGLFIRRAAFRPKSPSCKRYAFARHIEQDENDVVRPDQFGNGPLPNLGVVGFCG
jgi:hypothetical protein